jgi:hypothetical protein
MNSVGAVNFTELLKYGRYDRVVEIKEQATQKQKKDSYGEDGKQSSTP